MKPADGDEPSVPTDESQAPFALPDNASALLRLHDEADLFGRTDWFAFGTTHLNLDYRTMEAEYVSIPDALYEHVDPAVVEDISCPAATAGWSTIGFVREYDELARERTGKEDGVLPADEARELWQRARARSEGQATDSFFGRVKRHLGW